jgi:hypothetical protein
MPSQCSLPYLQPLTSLLGLEVPVSHKVSRLHSNATKIHTGLDLSSLENLEGSIRTASSFPRSNLLLVFCFDECLKVVFESVEKLGVPCLMQERITRGAQTVHVHIGLRSVVNGFPDLLLHVVSVLKRRLSLRRVSVEAVRFYKFRRLTSGEFIYYGEENLGISKLYHRGHGESLTGIRD